MKDIINYTNYQDTLNINIKKKQGNISKNSIFIIRTIID